MISRFDYYIVDDYGDVWNDDPLPTFGQAKSYQNYIRPSFNRISSLNIKSVERGSSLFEVTSSPMHEEFWREYEGVTE